MGTKITSLDSLKALPALQQLNCSHTQITSLDPLKALPLLDNLEIHGIILEDVAPILGLVGLRSLYAEGTQINGVPSEVLSSSEYDECLECLRAHVADLGPDPVVLSHLVAQTVFETL
ncbi:MAG: hypothetical protein QNJ09_05610 [Paracoccaceae bacterium]|nr:hypothetical protein [Paracoccaceae bacterium]